MKNILSLSLIAMIACPANVVFAAGYDAMGNATGGGADEAAAVSKASDPLSKLQLSYSPFEVCQNKTFLPSKLYNEDKEYWDTAMKECGDQVNLEVLPDDSFFTIKTLLTKLDGSENDQEKALDFLKQVGVKAKENIDFNIASTKKIVECAEHPKNEGCGDLLKSLSKSIEKVRPELRQAQALSAYDKNGQTVEQNEAQAKLNRHMGPASVSLGFEAKMEALNDDEFGDALDKFRDETKEIKKSWDEAMENRMKSIEAKRKAGQGNAGLDRAYEDAKGKVGKYDVKDYMDYQIAQRGKKMDKHREEYIASLSKAPILAYLGKDKAAENCASNGDAESCHALVTAAKKLQANAEAEGKKVTELMEARAKTGNVRAGGTRPKTVSEMLELMKYGPAVREVLGKNGQYCQAATGLTNLLENKKTRDNAAIMTGMIAGFVGGGYAGGAIAASLGASATTASILGATAAAVGTGGASIYHDAKMVDAAEQRVMTRATQDDGRDIADIKDLTEAKDALAMNIALSPTNLIGTGASALFARQAGVQVSRAGANKALVGALKQKGHSEAAINKMFADLQSKDAAIAQKAAQNMFNELGMEQETLDVIKKAGQKGLISMVTERAAAKAIRDEIKSAPMAKKVMEVLDNVNSAKLNDGNRLQVLETALAGAKFGVKEPKYLAAKINDWEEGLDGLTATYRLAEKKLAGVKGDQDKAFRLALAEQLEGKVAKEDMESTIEKMATCGLRGK